MKVAIVHDWLTALAGGEKVLSRLFKLFPDADLFTLVDHLSAEQRESLGCRTVTTSFLQRMPGARQHYRAYLPLMPLALEQFDMTPYDMVISSSHAVAKGVLTGPNQVHVSYVHSPMRYAWDLQHHYLREAGLTRGVRAACARVMLHYMRLWDVRTAHGPDLMIANSAYIARRIRKTYGRTAVVVHPPVDTTRFCLGAAPRERFFLTASRMVPYKAMPLIVEAFKALPSEQLIVVGDGPDLKKVTECAGPNVTILGHQPTDVLIDLMQRAQAFVFAAEEDFGIVPIEAQACGTPVIALGKGGVRETIITRPGVETGLFFDTQTPESLRGALTYFLRERQHRPSAFDPQACRLNALRFAPEQFDQAFMACVENAIADKYQEIAKTDA